jgi:site-specific recombinase XerD
MLVTFRRTTQGHLTVEEVKAILARLDGRNARMAELLFGAGLRLMECLRLLVKDVEFSARQIIVRNAKGFKHGVTVLPESTIDRLQRYLAKVKAIHEADLTAGFVEVSLPYALDRK